MKQLHNISVYPPLPIGGRFETGIAAFGKLQGSEKAFNACLGTRNVFQCLSKFGYFSSSIPLGEVGQEICSVSS